MTARIDIDDMKNRIEAGWTVKDLAHYYDVCEATVRNRIRQWGLSLRSKGRPQEDLVGKLGLGTKEEMEKELEEGGGMKHVYKRYGCSYQTFRRGLIRLGIENPGKYRSSVCRKALGRGEIGDRYLAGESARSLAKVYGVSHQTILNRLRQEGVEVRSVGKGIGR